MKSSYQILQFIKPTFGSYYLKNIFSNIINQIIASAHRILAHHKTSLIVQ